MELRFRAGGSSVRFNLFRRLVVPLFTAVLCASFLVLDARATAIVTRSPVPGTQAPDYLEFALSEDGVAQLNVDGATDELLSGYRTTTRALADNSTGQIRGSASFSLATSVAGPVRQAQFDNFLDGMAMLTGAEIGQKVLVTVQLDVHGSFADLTGNAEAGLIGYLYVGDANQTIRHGSQLEFGWMPATGQVTTSGRGFFGASPTGPADVNALPLVFSSAAGNLSGRARITFEASVGELLFVQGVLGGVVAPRFQAGLSMAGSGTVDAWNTAHIRMMLPSGFGLAQTSGVLAAPDLLINQPVPEPDNWQLLALGVGLLIGWKRQLKS